MNDTLVGNAGDNFLRGGLGADLLDGGVGDDTADYRNATVGIRVDLGNAATNTGEAAGDTFVSIENLRGGDFNDTLVGIAGDNTLNSGDGADSLNGGDGFDFFQPGSGVDTVNGTAGARGNQAAVSKLNCNSRLFD